MKIKPIYKLFFWPHPYAVKAGLFWRKLFVGYRYFNDAGKEMSFN